MGRRGFVFDLEERLGGFQGSNNGPGNKWEVVDVICRENVDRSPCLFDGGEGGGGGQVE